ncbi:GTPBP2, partial [Symbiodinium pilosum]
MLQGQCMDWDELPPENDEGCVEYKWRLGPEHSHRRVDRLATQMKFRLAEGSGKAFYLLGVRDSGFAEGLSAREHSEAVSVLMAAAGAADCILLLEALGCSTRSKKGRLCSVWRLEQRQAAVSKLSKQLHLCGSLADSLPRGRCRMEVAAPPVAKEMIEQLALGCGQ